ncbi:hypothetical protein [Glycomyces sp. NPDC048151]|uniref:hypothetical protein n=1 Tax=Glycomyces sp. NPDC048151 TaxID=3364002 RepID=UPI00371DD1A8
MFTVTASTHAADANRYFAGGLHFPNGDVEYFQASLDHWTIQQYTESWRSQLAKIASGEPVAVLLTNVQDPRSANFFRGWTVYNPGDGFLYFQDGLIFVEELPDGWTLDDLSGFAEERETETEEGHRISEWRIDEADIDPYKSIVVTDNML